MCARACVCVCVCVDRDAELEQVYGVWRGRYIMHTQESAVSLVTLTLRHPVTRVLALNRALNQPTCFSPMHGSDAVEVGECRHRPRCVCVCVLYRVPLHAVDRSPLGIVVETHRANAHKHAHPHTHTNTWDTIGSHTYRRTFSLTQTHRYTHFAKNIFVKVYLI